MKYAVRRWPVTLATAMLLGLVGCQDGKDGAPGEDGGVVSPDAEALTVAITDTRLVDGRLVVGFEARNELDLPVIRIDAIKMQVAQLQPYADGERSQWQVLGYDRCQPGQCAGTLEELGGGEYRYTFGGPLDSLYNAAYPQRVMLTVPATGRYPEAQYRYDAMADGSDVVETRNIIDDGRCLSCHESIDAIVHGGNETASCASCHTGNKMSDPKKVWPVLAHQVHIGLSSRPVGNCESCHETQANETLAQALNWQTVPTREACESCHELASNPIYDHAGQPTNGNCVECHSAQSINDVHLGGYQKAQEEDQRGIVTVDVESAKLVDGAEVGEPAGEHYALISVSLRDRAGERLLLDAANPGNATWIKNLQLYVNWGASVDFTHSRGYSIFVKSNKKHGPSIDGGYTPDGERPRTKPYLGGEQQAGVYVYKLGPIVTQDAISGDRLNDSGFISNRLIYCFDPAQNLVDCDTAGHAKNAAYNERWYFTKDGLTEAPAHARPVIVSNAKCGSCHGYDEASDNTELSCRNCHSRKTDMNKALADTTCFSGHDDDELGEHLLPRMERALTARSQSGFVSSTIARHPAILDFADPAQIAAFNDRINHTELPHVDLRSPAAEQHLRRDRFLNAIGGVIPDVTALLSSVIDDHINAVYTLAGYTVPGRTLAQSLPQDVATACVALLGDACLESGLHTRAIIQHANYDQNAHCGSGCSGNPWDAAWNISPTGWGDNHELGHNLQTTRLNVHYAAAGDEDNWSAYHNRAGENSNNLFPYYVKWRAHYLRDGNTTPISDGHMNHKSLFYGFMSDAAGVTNAAGERVVLGDNCRLMDSGASRYEAPWATGAYAAHNGYRMAFYIQMALRAHGMVLADGTRLENGFHLFTLLYQHSRIFGRYASDATSWQANRERLGFGLFPYEGEAVYGGRRIHQIPGNDFMLVALSHLTGRNWRSHFDLLGLRYSSLAAAQVAANAKSGALPMGMYVLETDLPPANLSEGLTFLPLSLTEGGTRWPRDNSTPAECPQP